MDCQLAFRQPFRLDIREIRERLHLSAGPRRCLIPKNHQDRHIHALGQIEEGRAAFNTIETAADEANRSMPRAWSTGDGELGGQTITAQPAAIIVDMLSCHPGDDQPADIEPIEQRP